MSAASEPSDHERTAASRRIGAEVLTGGHVAVVDEVLAAEFVDHKALPGTAPGPEGFKQAVQFLRTAFPDRTVTPQHYLVEGDLVLEHTDSSGTHDGPLLGLAPTPKPVFTSAFVIVRLNGEGKIVERWGVFNPLGILQQLGALPGGAGARPASAAAQPVAEETVASEDNRFLFTGTWTGPHAPRGHPPG